MHIRNVVPSGFMIELNLSISRYNSISQHQHSQCRLDYPQSQSRQAGVTVWNNSIRLIYVRLHFVYHLCVWRHLCDNFDADVGYGFSIFSRFLTNCNGNGNCHSIGLLYPVEITVLSSCSCLPVSSVASTAFGLPSNRVSSKGALCGWQFFSSGYMPACLNPLVIASGC